MGRHGAEAYTCRGRARSRNSSQKLQRETTRGFLAEIDCSLQRGEVDVGCYVVGPVVVGWLLEVGAAGEDGGFVAGGEGLETVGAVVEAEVGEEPDAHLLGEVVHEGEGAGRVLAHLQEALAAEHEQ